MSSTKKLWILSLLSLVAIYGCVAEEEGDGEEDEPQQTEDELRLRKGVVDNAGVVEATTLMLAGGPTDGLLDPYNREDPFRIASAKYSARFAQRLGRFDAYDGRTDWTMAQAAAWTRRMANGNYLVVDTSKPCDFANPHTYLEIERAKLMGRAHTTCGGRMPNEDALDVTLNFLIRGPAASAEGEGAITDGVDKATKKSAPTFPYLADPNGI